MIVIVTNTNTDERLKTAAITVYLKKLQTEEETIIENVLSNTKGVLKVPLSQEGQYRVEVSLEGYITQEVLTDISFNKPSCKKWVKVALVQKILVSLGWEDAPKNLNLLLIRSNFSSPCSGGCDTKQTCSTLSVLDCRAGASSTRGEEVVALSDPSAQRGAIYTVTVRMGGNAGSDQEFAASKALVRVQDGIQTKTVGLVKEDFVEGSKTWVVGCLWVLDEALVSGSRFQWAQLNTFSEKGPWAVGSKACIKHIDALRQAEVEASDSTLHSVVLSEPPVELCVPILGLTVAWQVWVAQQGTHTKLLEESTNV